MPFFEDFLVYLLKTSLKTSQFPDPWKIARVSPIFKDGDKAEKSNYRPTSVLPMHPGSLKNLFSISCTGFLMTIIS